MTSITVSVSDSPNQFFTCSGAPVVPTAYTVSGSRSNTLSTWDYKPSTIFIINQPTAVLRWTGIKPASFGTYDGTTTTSNDLSIVTGTLLSNETLIDKDLLYVPVLQETANIIIDTPISVSIAAASPATPTTTTASIPATTFSYTFQLLDPLACGALVGTSRNPILPPVPGTTLTYSDLRPFNTVQYAGASTVTPTAPIYVAISFPIKFDTPVTPDTLTYSFIIPVSTYTVTNLGVLGTVSFTVPAQTFTLTNSQTAYNFDTTASTAVGIASTITTMYGVLL